MTDRPPTDTATVAAPASTQPATRNEGPVFSSRPPHGAGAGVIPGGLEAEGRSARLRLEGPSGRVLARVELVLLGRAEPVSLPMVSVLDLSQTSSSADTH